MDSQDMCRCYKEHEEQLDCDRPKMEHARKDELKKLLAELSEGSEKS
ncbi:MAG: hypothetical protein ACPG3X_03340 [Opitutales bacterium]